MDSTPPPVSPPAAIARALPSTPALAKYVGDFRGRNQPAINAALQRSAAASMLLKPLSYNRVGKFSVSEAMLEAMFTGDDSGDAADTMAVFKARVIMLGIMGRCVILRAEFMLASRTIEYVALCADFEHCDDGMIPPTYRWDVTCDNVQDSSSYVIECVRVDEVVDETVLHPRSLACCP